MSVKVMSLVWDRFPASGSDLLCMLALADWCNDEGGSLHPSMATIAEKIRVSVKQARRIVRKFEDDGLLTVVANAGGGMVGASKHYRLNVQMIAAFPLVKAPKHVQERPGTSGNVQTPPVEGSPPMGGSPDPQESDDLGWGDPVDPSHGWEPSHAGEPSHGCPSTPPMGGSLTTIGTTINNNNESAGGCAGECDGESVDAVIAAAAAAAAEATAAAIAAAEEAKKAKAKKPRKPAEPELEFDGRQFTNIPADLIAYWKTKFKAIDVDAQIGRAEAWLNANPNNDKTKYKRFLVNWLTRQQDRAPPVGGGASPARPARPRRPESLPVHESGVFKL